MIPGQEGCPRLVPRQWWEPWLMVGGDLRGAGIWSPSVNYAAVGEVPLELETSISMVCVS